MKILVTGVAGFIGFHLANALIERGENILGVDNVSDDGNLKIKKARLGGLLKLDRFRFEKMELSDKEVVEQLFNTEKPEIVIHLAAQSGVRKSLKQPHISIESNIVGFVNVLEGCRQTNVRHLLFASSSSVYGENFDMPFTLNHRTDKPLSLYGASKKSNEVMAYSYSHLFGFSCTGLRFFTVYGAWGRPDMALYKFTKAILDGKPIDVFNEGNLERDFTYIDDIVNWVLCLIDQPKEGFKLYNLGYGAPINLMQFIEELEKSIGEKARLNLLPMQDGDVPVTYADNSSIVRETGIHPSIPIEVGVPKFVEWYREYYSHSYLGIEVN